MIVRFIVALLVWIFVGLLVAAQGTAQVPPDYSLIVGYGVLFVAWVVSYWIRARSATARRWWWLGGLPEVLLEMFGRGRSRARQGARDDDQQQSPSSAGAPSGTTNPVRGQRGGT